MWWALAACMGVGDPAPVAPEETGPGPGDPGPVDTAPVALSVRFSPDPVWPDGRPLRCVVEGGDAEVAWTLNGAPWTGAVGDSGEGPGGDLVPAEVIAAGQTWGCTARAGRSEASAALAVRPPSVVVILVDDLGWGDLGVHGGRAPTPRLDALAAQGVRFDRAYSASPVCGPSRAALLTGRQGSRFGFEYNLGDVRGEGVERRGLPVEEATLAERLRGAGLRTALIGKWHLGEGEEHHPNVRGFERFFGILDGRYVPLPPDRPDLTTFDLRPDEVASYPLSPTGQGLQQDGVAVLPDERHLTDRLADEAVGWLGEHAADDVFLLLSMTAPHLPLMATPEMMAAVPNDGQPLHHLYDATVHHLDAAIGRVVDALDESGLASHTIVAFLSDNGCLSPGDVCSNGPFPGGKLVLAEGGIRTPLLVRWPGRAAPGVFLDPVSSMDLAPTVLAAAGVPVDPATLDGVDLGPWLRGDGVGRPHGQLWWRQLPARAVLDGDVKVVEAYDRTWRFDLAVDPTESVNLHRDDPAATSPFLDALDARGLDAYVPPAWSGQQAWATYYGVPMLVWF